MSTIQEIVTKADQLRAVADFIEQHSILIDSLSYTVMREKLGTDGDNTPYVSMWVDTRGVDFTVYGPNQRETMRAFRRRLDLPGAWDKGRWSNTFFICTQPPQGVTVRTEGNRENVCQRVVTGVEEIEVPAVQAEPARIEYQDKVEW